MIFCEISYIKGHCKTIIEHKALKIYKMKFSFFQFALVFTQHILTHCMHIPIYIYMNILNFSQWQEWTLV